MNAMNNMSIPTRFGNGVRDVTGRISDNRETSRALRGRQIEFSDVRRERMNCSMSDEQLFQAQNWRPGKVNVRAVPVQEKKENALRKWLRDLGNSDGIRWNVAMAVLAVVVSFVLITLLVDLGAMGQTGRNIEKLNRKISTVTEANDRLRTELAYSENDMSILTEAVKLNLVSASSTVIRLHAPETANMSLNDIYPLSEDRLAIISGD